jgi:hypothetical protein
VSLYTVPELITKLEGMDFDDCQLADAQVVHEAGEALKRLSAQMAWLEAHVFERRWMPPIGSPFTWEMAGPYRHALRAMRGGETLGQAIDLAMKLYPMPEP